MNVWSASRKDVRSRRAIDPMDQLGDKTAFAASGRATNQICVRKAIAFLCAKQVLERVLLRECHFSEMPQATA